MEKHKTILHGPTHFFKNLMAKDWKTLRGMLLAGEKERNIYRGNNPHAQLLFNGSGTA